MLSVLRSNQSAFPLLVSRIFQGFSYSQAKIILEHVWELLLQSLHERNTTTVVLYASLLTSFHQLHYTTNLKQRKSVSLDPQAYCCEW